MAKTKFDEYDSTAASNTDVGGVNIQGTAAASNMDDGLREVMSHIADHFASDTIASGTTTDLGSKAAHALTVSGTTTITGFGTVKAGTVKLLTFSGALTLTHNGTSLIIPGAANITTAAGDTAIVQSLGSGNWRVLTYQLSTTTPVKGTWTPALTFATAGDLSVAYSTQIGSYVRNGDIVTLWFNVITSTFTHSTASGNLRITGLPFTAGSNPSPNVAAGTFQHSNVASGLQLGTRIDTGSSYIVIAGSANGIAGIVLDTSHFPTGTAFTLRGCISYLV